jgi:hypothetical protein
MRRQSVSSGGRSGSCHRRPEGTKTTRSRRPFQGRRHCRTPPPDAPGVGGRQGGRDLGIGVRSAGCPAACLDGTGSAVASPARALFRDHRATCRGHGTPCRDRRAACLDHGTPCRDRRAACLDHGTPCRGRRAACLGRGTACPGHRVACPGRGTACRGHRVAFLGRGTACRAHRVACPGHGTRHEDARIARPLRGGGRHAAPARPDLRVRRVRVELHAGRVLRAGRPECRRTRATGRPAAGRRREAGRMVAWNRLRSDEGAGSLGGEATGLSACTGHPRWVTEFVVVLLEREGTPQIADLQTIGDRPE